MKNTILTLILIIVLIASGIYLSKSQEDCPEEIMMSFLEELLTASPENYDEIYHINIFDQLDTDTYTIDTYASMATERMMVNMVANRTIGISSEVAYKSHSNVTLENLEITSTQESDEKVYFDFKAITKVKSIDTLEERDYPLVGQIGLKKMNDTFKVDTLKFYSIELLEHLMQSEPVND